MANIAVLMDSEEGHLFSTFRLAKDLEKRGHNVWYLGFRDTERLVLKQNLKFVPVFRDNSNRSVPDEMPHLPIRPLISGEMLNSAVQSIGCDLFLTLSMFCLEGIILRHRYSRPVVLLRNHFSLLTREQLCRELVIGRLMHATDEAYELVEMLLGAGVSIKNFADIAALATDEMSEIVLFPELLGSDPMRSDKKVCYAGLAVDTTRSDESFQWGRIDLGRKVVYCSLGSQAHLRFDVSHRFFKMLVEIFAKQREFQLVLATGRQMDAGDFVSGAENVLVAQWVPQVEVLRRADLMINHAGIGSVQECIAMGVPMILFPLMRDQFACADRVIDLGLGVRGDSGDCFSGSSRCVDFECCRAGYIQAEDPRGT